MSHTVEKIGGTSMASEDVLDNVLIGARREANLYGRIFVVSAYAGITDRLLEDKRTGTPGVHALYSDADSGWTWSRALSTVESSMVELNEKMLHEPTDRHMADSFVRERIEGARSCLLDLQRLCGYGHFRLEEHLCTVRELLAGLGEAHSAHNTVLMLRRRSVNAAFVDLTGWREQERRSLDAQIADKLSALDVATVLPIVTGYAHCTEGLVSTYQRGYSEITFSRIATVTGAREAVIHKEYHLSTADPRIVGVEHAVPIGRTNYDVADQLSLLRMEAIHPGAARALRRAGIPLRVKRTFEPEHAGTLIDGDYASDAPCVEIIAGRRGVYALEVFDHDMLDRRGHQAEIQQLLDRHRVAIVTRESNANNLTHYLASEASKVDAVRADIEDEFPQAVVRVRRVAVVCAIGSDLDVPGLLASCVQALAEGGVGILAIHQSIRAVDIKFVVDEQDYETAIVRLHARVIDSRRARVARVA